MSTLRTPHASLLFVAALSSVAGAQPQNAGLTLEVLAPAISVEAPAASAALEPRREAVTRCLAGVRKLVRGEFLAVMTVDAKGAVARVDVAGQAAPAVACIKKLVGAKLASGRAGAFATRVTIEPPPPSLEAKAAAYVDVHGGLAVGNPGDIKSGPAPGGLTSQEISETIKTRAGVIKACYEKELSQDSSLAAGGKVVVAFVIGGDGAVSKVSAKQAYHPSVDACVLRQVQKLRFPAKGSQVHVSYPFLFKG